MTKNRKRYMDFITNVKNDVNIEIYDFTFGDGYFVFEMGKDTVMHFKMKGLPDWKWGAWLTQDEKDTNKYTIEVFTQHELFIDKFKPSRSNFSYKYELEDGRESAVSYYKLEDWFEFCQKHEAMAWLYDDDITNFDGELKAKWVFAKAKFNVKYERWVNPVRFKAAGALAALFSSIGVLKAVYEPDTLNDEGHINDRWYIWYKNWIGAIGAKSIYWLIDRRGDCLGDTQIFKKDEELEWALYAIQWHTHQLKDNPTDEQIEEWDVEQLEFALYELWNKDIIVVYD